MTPLMMNMSSVRPTNLPMRAVVRPHAQGSCVRVHEVPCAVAQHRRALARDGREDELADFAIGDRLARRRVEALDDEVILVDVLAERHSHSPATPGPMTSVSP